MAGERGYISSRDLDKMMTWIGGMQEQLDEAREDGIKLQLVNGAEPGRYVWMAIDASEAEIGTTTYAIGDTWQEALDNYAKGRFGADQRLAWRDTQIMWADD